MRLRYNPFRQEFEHSREYDNLTTYERKLLLNRVRGWCRDWNGQRAMHFSLPVEPRVMMRPPSMPHRMVQMKRVEVILTEAPIPGRRENVEEKARRELMDFVAKQGRLAWPMLRPNAFLQMAAGNDKPPRDFMLPTAQQKAMADMKAYCVADVKAQIALAPPLIDNPKPVKPPLGKRPNLSRWQDGDHFVERLKKRGYKLLGAGCFSMVLAKPGSDRVIKVNFKSDNWLDYVVWAAKVGQAGKMAPKVYSYRRFNEGRHGEFYVAIMERMECCMDDLYRKDPRKYAAYSALREFIDFSRDAEGVAAEVVIPGAIAFGVMLRSSFKGQRLDLHGNNWMVRKDGTIACTDPLCDGKSSAPSRMRSRDLAALSVA
jgi:hypothetical protein